MNHQQTITKPVHVWKIFNVFFVILIIFFIGCKEKNEAKKNEAEIMNTDSTSTTMNQSETAARIATPLSDFYTLKLTKEQYDSLKKYNGSKKIIMQFLFRSSEPKSPTMLAYPAKMANKYFSNNTGSAYNPAELTIGLPLLKVQPEMILGDQEILYENIDDFLKMNNINLTMPYTLVFSPDIDATKHIYYNVTVEGVQTLAGTLITNPSPPKDAY